MSTLAQYANDVRSFEWDTLLGEITLYRPREIKRAVEERDHKRFRDEVAGLRLEIDELERRMAAEAVVCSVCEKVIPADPRGDVLDSSGRCFDCTP